MRAIMLAVLMAGMAISAASASDVVSVTWRKAQIMSFGSGVSGIIIGDPSVIDVTVEASGQIVVFGKVPGETNMMVIGADNTVLFDAPVVVMPEDDRQVSIISVGADTISERSWTCLSRCVQVLGPGGTKYSSVKPAGGGTIGSQIDANIQSQNEANAAATQAAKDISEMTRATGKGASSAGSNVGTIVAPY